MHFCKWWFVCLFFFFSRNVFADHFLTQVKFLDYHGQHIYVKEKKAAGEGDRPLVVLLNSVSLPSVEAFDVSGYSLMEQLASAGYDVWGFDFVNQGHSTFSEKTPLTIDHALEQLSVVLQHIQQESHQKKISLLGWSWGTMVAAKYAIAHPDKVQHLILYAAMYASPMPEPQQKMMIHSLDTMPLTQPIAWPMIQNHWNNMLSSLERERNKAAMEVVSNTYCHIQAGPDCRITRLREQMLDLFDSWTGKPKYNAQSITVPTLVIYGSGDFFADNTFFNELTHAPYKEQVVIQDASHWLLYENKRTIFYQSIIHFLGTHESSISMHSDS